MIPRLVLTSAFVVAAMCLGVKPCHGFATGQTGTAAPQPEWEFRLVNLTNPNASQGLFEARAGPNGTWGKICGWSLNPAIAGAACASVGFPGTQGSILSNLPDTQNLTFTVGYIDCPVGAATLANCTVVSPSTDECSPTDAFGLNCAPGPVWEARIVPQNATLHTNRGLLQVRQNGTEQWGWVCSYNAYHAAMPACRSAGFPNTTAATLIPYYGGGVGPMFMGDVQCIDGATDLSACSYQGDIDCDPTEAMGVDCGTAPGRPPTVLFNATVSYGATLLVSNVEFELNVPADMIVVAGVTQLNNSSATGPLNAVAFYLSDPNSSSGGDVASAETTLVIGGPTLLFELNVQSITNNNTAGIIGTMQFRLVGGATATSGLLQMRPFPEADWGTVCAPHSSVDPMDPAVMAAACRSAGIANPTPTVLQPNYTASGYIWASNVGCSAGATMADCNFLYAPPSQPSLTGCTHDYDLWLDCLAPTPAPTNTVAPSTIVPPPATTTSAQLSTAAPSATVTTTATPAPAAVEHFVANVTDAASFSLAAFEGAMRSRYGQCSFSAFAIEDDTGYVQFAASPAGCLDVAAVAQAPLGISDLRVGYAPPDVVTAPPTPEDHDKKTRTFIIAGAAVGACMLLIVTILVFRARGRRVPTAGDLSTKLRADPAYVAMGDYNPTSVNHGRSGGV
jgi:hypothetical protein